MRKLISLMLALLMAVLPLGALAETDGHYPVTVSNYDGYIESNKGAVIEQTFEACPERIVSISQAATEVLIALGVEDKIVGTAHKHSEVYAPFADIYNSIPFMVDGAGYPSKEVMIEYEPDLIVGWGSLFDVDAMGSVVEWHEKGIHTYIMNNTVPGLGNRQVSWILDDIAKLGQILDVEDRANELIAEIEGRLAKVAEKTGVIPEDQKPTIATVQYMYENSFLPRASTDLTADIITLSGGICLDDASGEQSLEVLIEKNPEIILVIDLKNSPAEETIAAMKAHASLQNVEAVKNDNFLVIEHAAFYCGCLRTIEAVEALADLMVENYAA